MNLLFQNRREAGRQLAAQLLGYAQTPNLLVLALPRGGVPVGFEVAQALQAPLDVFVVRKLGVPGYEELALGAIAWSGIVVLDRALIQTLQLSPDAVQATITREQTELARRHRLYRGERPPPLVAGQTVILVDDGLATGATMHAASAALHLQQPAQLIIGTPVAAPQTCAQFRAEGETVVCVSTPVPFSAVGRWYVDFSQTTDEEVCALLAQAAASQPTPPAAT